MLGGTHWNPSEPVGTCWDPLEPVGTRKNLLGHVRTRSDLLEHVSRRWIFYLKKLSGVWGGYFTFKIKIIPPPPPPPPPPPSPFSPFWFGGGGRGGGGGEGGGDGGGTIAPSPSDFNGFFCAGPADLKHFHFSLSLYSLCVIYPRGRSSVHSSKLQKLMVSSQQKTKFIVAYFNEI